jgi:predicted PurR-regulated permease PerM
MPPAKIEVSHKTIVFTAFFLIFLWFLYRIRYIILLLFVAVILMSSLSPLVDRLEKRKIPRGLAILFFYAIIWGLISFGIASLVPPLVEQSTKFISFLPQFLANLSWGKLDISIFQSHLSLLPQQIIKLVVGIFNNLVSIFTLMVIVFYLIMERKNLKKYLVYFFGSGDREKQAEHFIDLLEHKLGGWMRGELVLMLIIGLLSYIGLSFLGVQFAIPLAFLAGLMEIIPNLGPTISMVPAILVAWGSSPILALAVFALYFVIQQLENNLIVPRVMKKAVGLSPLVTIISLLIGFRIAGVAGAVLAVPSVLLSELIINQVYLKRH